MLGPNGAGKTTLLQLARPACTRPPGVVGILGERLGTVDVFELRPRIGLASRRDGRAASRADERVLDVVLTASYAVVGRWREAYDRTRRAPRRRAARGARRRPPRRPHASAR